MSINERGVSPVVGTILLIAITVILAGTIGFFAMQQGTPEAAPTASLSVEVASNETIMLYHNGGDDINANVTASNDTITGFSEGTLTAGESRQLFGSSDVETEITVTDIDTNTVLLRSTVGG